MDSKAGWDAAGGEEVGGGTRNGEWGMGIGRREDEATAKRAECGYGQDDRSEKGGGLARQLVSWALIRLNQLHSPPTTRCRAACFSPLTAAFCFCMLSTSLRLSLRLCHRHSSLLLPVLIPACTSFIPASHFRLPHRILQAAMTTASSAPPPSVNPATLFKSPVQAIWTVQGENVPTLWWPAKGQSSASEDKETPHTVLFMIPGTQAERCNARLSSGKGHMDFC